MLAPNSILNQGRYRVASNFWSNASHALYEAHDNLFGQHVVICEGPDPRASGVKVFDRDADKREFSARFDRLRSLSHEALIGVRDHFYHADRKYLVSDAVDGTSISQLAALRSAPVTIESVVTGLERIIDAYSRFASVSGNIRYFGTDPGSIRITREGELRFLFFGTEDESAYGPDELENTPRSALSFMPLETLWPRLDIASQKVISNNYDERSLEVLESAPDHRSDIFTLGSVGYFLLSGQVPVGALERSIEVLDGYPDPLKPVHLVEPTVPVEVSEFIAKSMNLYRQDRFDSFPTISRQLAVLVSDFSQLPSTPTSALLGHTSGQPHPAKSEVKLDEMDLLEIPGVPASAPAAFAHTKNSNTGVATSTTAALPVDFELPRPTPAVDRFEMPIRPRKIGSVAQLEEPVEPPKAEFRDLFDAPVETPTTGHSDLLQAPAEPRKAQFPGLFDSTDEAPKAEYSNLIEEPESATSEVRVKADVVEQKPFASVPAKPLYDTKPAFEQDIGLDVDLYDDVKPKNKAWAKPALIAASVVMALVVGSWILYSYSGSSDQSSTTAADAADTKAIISAEPAQTLDVVPQADTTSTQTATPNKEAKAEPVHSETVREPAPDVPAQAVKPRTAAAEPTQKVEPRPATAQVPPKQKKKITVDDLINDN